MSQNFDIGCSFNLIDSRKRLSEGKPTRKRRICLKNPEAAGRGGLGITSSSEEVYEFML